MGNLRTNAIAQELASRPVSTPRTLQPGTFSNARVTVASDGTVTNLQNGPRSNSASAAAGGGIVTFQGGATLQWGKSAACPTGGPAGVVAVVFPQPFANPPIVTCNPDGLADGSGNKPFTCIPSSITNTGFTANFNCPVQIGGGGAAGIFNTVHADWHALGF